MSEFLWGLTILLGGLLVLLMWSLLAVSAEADRRAEQSFEEWKRKRDGGA